VTCPKCNGTRSRQCSYDCPRAILTGVGRGWHCDVDARGERGCPPCNDCDGRKGDNPEATLRAIRYELALRGAHLGHERTREVIAWIDGALPKERKESTT